MFKNPIAAAWRPRLIAPAVLGLVLFARTALATTYYISPSGNNSNNGLSSGAPKKTFAAVFTAMAAADELILLDGTYSSAAGTGYINWNDGTCATCDQPKSGTSVNAMTWVHAQTPGNVIVDGNGREGLFLGRSFQKASYIKIQGITFKSGGSLYNTSYNTIKDCGFYSNANAADSVFGIGTNDGNWGNTYNLVEDCWIWGNDRIIVGNYRASFNVWRRVVVRGDGCNSADCAGDSNPNVGFTVYNSSFVSVQNMIVVDRVLDGGAPYGDFATAQHNAGSAVDQGAVEYLSNNEWLGDISLHSEDGGYHFEADGAGANEPTIRNCLAWDNGTVDGGGFNIGKETNNLLIENITSGVTTATNDGVRVAPDITGSGTLRNVIAYNSGRYGINSVFTPSYSDVFNATSADYNQTGCATGCKSTNPLSDGSPTSLKYIARIEVGSALKGTGFGGGDYGANIVKQYGTSGTRYGDSGYNTLSGTDLWPWPNEARIKSDFNSTAASRGFTAAASLTDYVWTYLGNANPYTGTDTTKPTLSVASAVDSTHVDVTFSEPVEQATAENSANYSIDHSVTVSGATLDANLQTVHLVTSVQGTNSYTVTVSNVRDRAASPNTIIAASTIGYSFTADTTAPTISSVTYISATSLDVTFSESVTQATAETAANYAIDNGVGTPLGAVLQSNLKTVRLTTNAHGTNAYILTINNVQDRANPANTIASNSTVGYSVDATPPAISVRTITSSTTVDVTFAETVDRTSAQTAGNYAIDNGITVNTATLDASSTTVHLVTSAHGNATFTLTINGVKDRASPANTLTNGTTQYAFAGDSTPPTLSSAAAVTSALIDVTFSESVEQASAQTTGNYAINNGITISAAALQANLKTVRLTTSIHGTNTYTVTVSNVKDRVSPANTIVAASTVSYTFTADTTPPAISTAVATSSTTLDVTFTEPVETASAQTKTNYTVNNGITVSAATLDANLQTVHLVTSAHGSALFTLTVNNVKDLANPVNTIAANSTASYNFAGDSTPPTISTAAIVSSTLVDVTFSEAVEQTSAQTKTNYTVDNGVTVSGAVLQSDLKTVRLTTSAHGTGSFTVTVSNVKDRVSPANTIVAASPATYNFTAAGGVVINEIMYDPTGSDTNHEWLEIFNASTQAVNLTGWTVRENNTNRTLSFIQGGSTIPVGGYAIIADNATVFKSDYSTNPSSATWMIIDPNTSFSGGLSNTGESLALRNGSGVAQSSLTYSGSSPWPIDSGGHSIERIYPAGADNSSSNWALGPTNGTPGAENTAEKNPPTLSAASAPSATQVDVTFSESVEQASAQTASNYSLDNNVAVSAAALDANLKTVHLTVAAMTSGTAYTVTVSTVTDRAAVPNAIVAGSAATFTYTVTSSGGGGGSSDTTSPTLDSASAVSATKVDAKFSEELDETSAQTASNYSIDNGVTVLKATLLGDLKSVRLTTTAHARGTLYTLTVSNVKDRAVPGNAIAPNSGAVYVVTDDVALDDLKPDHKYLDPQDGHMSFGVDATDVIIRDSRGNVIFQGNSGGGSVITWDGNDSGGRSVESGVYVSKIRSRDGTVVHHPIVVVK